MTNVLIADPDSGVQLVAKQILEAAGLVIVLVASAPSAVDEAMQHRCAVALVGWDIGGDLGGLKLLVDLRTKCPHLPVLMLSPYPDVGYAARAARLGAFDYIELPLKEERLLESVNAALTGSVKRTTDLEPFISSFVAASARSMETVMDAARYAKQENCDVLLVGETGTGKEVLAKLMHEQSPRSHAPFIAENCASIPTNLEESELFGHEKGAFTGANKQHCGAFERTGAGTLFLDEVEELPIDLQAKLLRVVEGRRFRRVGGEKELIFAGRIIYASNCDLAELIRRNLFRQDLYHRISTHHISIAPLRNRLDDLIPLGTHFIRIYGKTVFPSLSSAAEALLRSYSFPGNVRELEGIIRYALLRCDGKEILPRHLPLVRIGLVEANTSEHGKTQEGLLDLSHEQAVRRLELEFNREYLPRILTLCNNNLTKAAQKAGLDPKTFRRKWDESGLGRLSTR